MFSNNMTIAMQKKYCWLYSQLLLSLTVYLKKKMYSTCYEKGHFLQKEKKKDCLMKKFQNPTPAIQILAALKSFEEY